MPAQGKEQSDAALGQATPQKMSPEGAGELPVGWIVASLGDTCEILDSRRSPINSSERNKRIEGKPDSELFPYYGATGVAGKIDGYLFEGEHVLIGEDAAPFLEPHRGVSYLVDGRFWVNNHAHILRHPTSNRFLCYYLRQVNYRPFVTGTTRLKLNQEQLRKIPIPLPPLAEQKRIVAKIEELFSELDAGEENLRRARRQLGVYRQSLLKQAFEGKLTEAWREQNPDLIESPDQLLARIQAERKARYQRELEEWEKAGKTGKKPQISKVDDDFLLDPDTLPSIPEGWHWRRLDQIAEIGTGMSVSKARAISDSIEVPYLRVANVQRGSLDLAELKTMPIEREKLDDLRLKPGDVLFNEGGDRDKLGRGWVWPGLPDPCITQNHVFRATIVSEAVALPEFVSHWGNAFGQDFFHLTGKQTTNLASISKAVLKSLPVPVPHAAEQREILRILDLQFEVIERNEREIDAALKRSEALRQSILKKAFTGRLVPQDPADEPASVLLERIREERALADQVPKREAVRKKAKTK